MEVKMFNSMTQNLRSFGINLEDNEGEELLPTARVKSDPVKVKVEEIKLPEPSLKAQEMFARNERNRIIKNAKNFTEGVDLYKNFQWVDIYKMVPCAGNWNYFNEPNDSQFISLTNSVNQIGVIQPLILLHDNDEDEEYTILVGQSRHLALRTLYENGKNERFRFAPCFILNRTEVGEYYARILVLDSNFSYRSIDQTVLIKALIERFMLLQKTRQFRAEINIADALANEFLMSRSTVFNYLCLRKLCEEVMVLLLEKRIKLQSARYLARVSHDTQRMILEKYGIEQVNIIHRIKFITNEDPKTEERLAKRIEIANTLVPFTTNISVTINKDLLGDYIKLNADFNVNAMINYEGKFQRNNSKYYFNFRFSEEDMNYYLEKGYVDATTLSKINAKNFAELKNIK